MVEVGCESPSHFVDGSATGSRLDRIFLALPTWALYGLILRSAVIEDPMAWSIGDHTLVEVFVELRAMRLPGLALSPDRLRQTLGFPSSAYTAALVIFLVVGGAP